MTWLRKIADQNPPTFIIQDSHLPWLDKKIDALNKVAKKLSLPPVGYKVLERNILQTHVNDPKDTSGLISDIRTATKIEIFGEAPVIQGWKFVARILHGDQGNILKSVPGEELPTQYRTAPPLCEHCGLKRKRNDTFVLKNITSGEFKQVGSNCLADFLGHGNPGLYASFAENMADLAEDLEGFEDEWGSGQGGGFESSIDIHYFLKVVYALIKRGRWVSRSKAEMGQVPTADVANNMIYGARRDPKTATELKNIIDSLSPDDESMLEDALIWARGLKDGTDDQKNNLVDYYWNLSLACSQERVKAKTDGIIASLPIAYDKAVLKTIKPDPSNTVGQKGQSVVVQGKIVEERMFGDQVVYDILTDQNQMVRTAFPSESPLEGKTVAIEGVVTGYSRKFMHVVSVLSRSKLLSVEEVGQRAEELKKEQTKTDADKPDYQVGQKVTVNLTVLKLRDVESQYGTTTLVSMVDDFGMTVKWWASNSQDVEEGEKINVTATVKSVGAYQGNPEITITRPKINSRSLPDNAEDERLSPNETKLLKKEIKRLETEFSSLCFGISSGDRSPLQIGAQEYDPTLQMRNEAIKQIVTPVFHPSLPWAPTEHAFLNPEQWLDLLIQKTRERLGDTEKLLLSDENYKRSNGYILDSAVREKKEFEIFCQERWTNGILPDIQKAAQEQRKWHLETVLERIPHTIKNDLYSQDRGFSWSNLLNQTPPDQWVEKIRSIVEPAFESYRQKLEAKVQQEQTNFEEKYQNDVKQFQQDRQSVQSFEEHKDEYLHSLQQMIVNSPIRKFLEAKPQRDKLSEQYNRLMQRLENSKQAIKQYGPKKEDPQPKDKNWLTDLLQKTEENKPKPKRYGF